MFALRQRKTVLNKPGARLRIRWLMTGEHKKDKNEKQANRRPFWALDTPTLDSLCSLMFPMCTDGPIIRPKYFPCSDPGQKEGGK